MLNLFLNLFMFFAISIAQLGVNNPKTSVTKEFNQQIYGQPPSKHNSDLQWSNGNALTTFQENDYMPREERSRKEFDHFIGSNLFDGDRKICFSPEDVNILAARMEFEQVMIPRDMTPIVLDDKSVCVIMRYFCYGHLLIRRLKDCSTSRVLKKAFFDAFGGFMHHYLLPVVKISFYVGDVQLKTVRKVINYYQKCRFFLNTNGNGWRTPLNFPLESINNISLKSTHVKDNSASNIDSNVDYCMGFHPMLNNLDGDMDENMMVALPKLENENNDGLLGNIWLPFSGKTTFSLRSFESAFILVGFYKKVSLCYLQRHIPQGSFDKKFREWIANNLLPHLNDEEFYPSLGGLIGLYKSLEKSNDYFNIVERKVPDHTNISKRDSTIQRRGTSTYNNLANKVKGSDECEMNWLKEINKFSNDKNAIENLKRSKKKNKKKKDKKNKKKKKIKDRKELEEKVTDTSSDEIENKNEDDKKTKKSFFKWNWRKWFGFSGNSSKKNNNETKKKKKSFFKWKWPKLFEFPNFNWSFKWGWPKLLKDYLKFGIIILVAIIIFCLLCKLFTIIAGILCGAGGSIGCDCFGVIMNLIFGFLKNVLQVLAVLFTCTFAAMCNWCGKAAKYSQPHRQDFEKPALPELRINSEPSTAKRSKRKKSGASSKKSDHSEVSEELKTKKSTTKVQTEDEKNGDKEEISGRRSRSCTKKRCRGGQSIQLETPSDSSPSSEERTSWKTFYDF